MASLENAKAAAPAALSGSHRRIATSETPTGLRYEIKLLLAADDLARAEAWVRLHPQALRRTRPPRRVNRLYFDTAEMGCLAAHMAGVTHRLKARLHWYGDDWSKVQKAWLELKVKHGTLGHKPRWPLADTLDLRRPWSEIMPAIWSSVPHEVRVELQTVTRPAILAHYMRSVYSTPDDAIKVTIDSDQAAYDQRLGPRPNVHAPLRVASPVVIEVKAPRACADRAWELVSAFPGRPYRYSKYVDWTLTALYAE